MKKLLTLIFATCIVGVTSAQLTNSGGTIVIESGATLVVESDINNNGTGSIVNSGTLEVKGDITSEATATFTSNSNSKVLFSGSGNSNASFLAANTTLEDVEMAMTGGNLTLGSDLNIDGDLTFTQNDNQILIGTNNVILGTNATTDNAAVTNSFIVTDGSGVVTKEDLTTTFEFPVGAAIDSQNDITLTEAGTTDDISVRVLADAYDDPTVPSGVKVADVVGATWEITEATAGGSDLTIAPSWTVATDETTDFANDMSAVYYYNGTDYTGVEAPGAATVTSGVANISNAGYTDLNGTNYVIVGDDALANLTALIAAKVFLQGPYSASANLMADQLRTKSLIPLTEPYTGYGAFTHVADGGGESVSALADFDYADAGDDIVDWVFVELLDGSDVTVATRSALIQRDGDIVDIDGNNSAVDFGTITSGDYSIVVRHRNHLGVKSTLGQMVGPGMTTSYDFTTGAGQATGSQQVELESGVWGMYSGNTNGDEVSTSAHRQIRMSGPASINDYTELLDRLGFNPSTIVLDVYEPEDLSMDGNVRMSGPASINDYTKLLQSLGFNPSTILIRSF